MKVRKKPVIVDAMPFYKDLWEMKPDKYPMVSLWALTELVTPYPYIGTLERPMKVSDGDYIIKGVNGEFYPCKPDIFEKTYEVATSLTDDQQVVLEWLKGIAGTDGSLIKAVYNLYHLNLARSEIFKGNEKLAKVRTALRRLTRQQEAEVLAAFANYGLEANQ